jgi:hypothetical protein
MAEAVSVTSHPAPDLDSDLLGTTTTQITVKISNVIINITSVATVL